MRRVRWPPVLRPPVLLDGRCRVVPLLLVRPGVLCDDLVVRVELEHRCPGVLLDGPRQLVRRCGGT